jgi:hypothetical protein
MIRGADAQFNFNIPYPCSDLEFVKIVFWQPENKGLSADRPLPIMKVLEQCFTTDKPKQLSVILDREETLRFSDKRKAYTQLRGTTKDGITFGSKQTIITVYPTLDDSLLDDLTLPTPTNDYIYFDGESVTVASDEEIIQMDGNRIK